MRYARILSLLALITFVPATLAAAPRNRGTAHSPFERVIKIVKRTIAATTRIGIPIGAPDPEPTTVEPPSAPEPTAVP